MKNIRTIKIGNRTVGEGKPTYIIFEVASTHERDWNVARDYVKIAKDVGADAIKFQLFNADKLLNPVASYLMETYKYFKNTEMPRSWLPRLMELCQKQEIDLLCTPFDEDAVAFLYDIGIPAIKIASSELTNTPLLKKIAKFNKPVILSTGMATMPEIRIAVNILKENGCPQLALLQCVSVYPMPYEEANIKAMQTLQNKFGCVMGYSDNGSKGYLVPLVAVALGASIIEKHVTIDKKRGHLDDIFALNLKEFGFMVKRIRHLEKNYKGRYKSALDDLKKEFGQDVKKVLGSKDKSPAKVGVKRADGTYMLENDERYWGRRGVYPKRLIKKGKRLSINDFVLLRPDIGISAKDLVQLKGLKAADDLKKNIPIVIEKDTVRTFKKRDIWNKYNRPCEKQFAQILSTSALFT